MALDSKRLFHAAAEDGIAVLVLFDKEVFVVIVHNVLLVCIYFAIGEGLADGLRHSYISYRLAVLHDTARVALEAGNSSEVIFMHYRELVTPEEAYAWFNVKPE
jgi:hypothetical protein